MKRSGLLALYCAITVTLSGCVPHPLSRDVSSQPKHNINVWPQLDIDVKKDPAIEKKVSELLATMTLEQKVAQMIQPEIRDITVEEMRQYGFGSYLNGGGAFPNNDKHATTQDWVDLAEAFYQASIDDSIDGSTIPTMWGTDAVHGHNNVIGATLFPHNIGLGAARNPKLIRQIAEATAKEVMATGIDWVFAPTVATVRDDRWGRTYEGYSEDPEIVKAYAREIVHGLQGEAEKDFLSDKHVISTVKHFLGDGGTLDGDDQGDNVSTEQQLFDIHAQGYVSGLSVGAQTVMASFNSWHGEKIHGSEYLLTDVLKERMGFDGLVVGDWNGHGQVNGCSNESCPQSINAGLDIFMVPGDWKALYHNTLAEIQRGEIPMERVDDAVTRILRVKFRAGLFDKPSPANRPLSDKPELIGADEHRAIARQAVRESLVLLKNKGGLLPLDPRSSILLAGDGADNIGKQSGGWSITWQGTNNINDDFPGGTSIFAGIKAQVENAGGKVLLATDGNFIEKPDVAVVVYGEEPYAEGQGDVASLEYQSGIKSDLKLLKKFKAQGIPVVSVFISGRPLWVNPELNVSDAFVAAWLPGTEGGGIADVILRDSQGNLQYDFTGKLSFSWPNHPLQIANRGDDQSPLLPYGFGLSYQDENLLADNLNESLSKENLTTATHQIFVGGLKPPWKMKLSSGSHSLMVSSSTHKVGSLSYRTMDKNVQEDAFLLKTEGVEKTHFLINAENQSDLNLSAVDVSKSFLSFSVNPSSVPDGSVTLSMRCKDMVCEKSLDISQQLKQLSNNQWHTLSYPLSCFVKGKQGVSIEAPFQLVANKKYEMQLADIEISPSVRSKTLSCD